MDILAWLLVGLAAGTFATLVSCGSSFGIVGDIALGILGAFAGSWGFRQLGWNAPFAGIFGTIAVAFLGALVLLAAIHLVTRRGLL